MKKLFFFVTIALFFTNSFGSSIIVPTSKLKATEVYIVVVLNIILIAAAAGASTGY